VRKAFTRESDEIEPEEIRSARPQLTPGVKNYITRQGADRLRNRLNELLEERRITTPPDSEPTRRPDQRIDSAIRRLESILSSVVIAEAPMDPDKVAFGASVLVRYATGDEESYRIVGVDEADPAHDRISWISPLAQALLNQRAGAKILFASPAGEQELTVVKVQYDCK